MNAEITMHEGRPAIRLSNISDAERSLLEHLRPWLALEEIPVTKGCEGVLDPDLRITGDRLPGMGNLQAQDATAPAVSTEESIARKREAQNVTCAYPDAVELPGVSRSYSPGEIESLVWLSHHSTSLQGSTAARIVLDRVIVDLEAMRDAK